MKNKFTFRPLDLSDVPLMCQWFNLPHVMKFNSLRKWTENEVLEKLSHYISGEKPVLGFIVLMNEKPIGYVQQYKVSDYPWSMQNLFEEIINNAAGMDLLLAMKVYLVMGLVGRSLRNLLKAKFGLSFGTVLLIRI